ncbi:RNA-binding CRS1 / YhbY (CRM) domain protein [Wolffia australiana]
MWAARATHRHFRAAISLLQTRNLLPGSNITPRDSMSGIRSDEIGGAHAMMRDHVGTRFMSVARGTSSMRSRVERRMRRETGRTLREIRRARKLRKKLMTDEERLMYNLRRAKKKVALLLQKLKKYELPELPTPRHDPELLTPEQLQAYKKIGFRNKNYVPVGVRGVFGGVVQNMHLHWKFHETVQVCCDNFPKEKIKDMAIMLARLSGGIVVNIHNVKTIIMFRGRNYRQPKNLIPINTLTKRKALFKARFEQALESQKLNIKKLEQDLRRKGVNPEDPVALASIQRVAATFFRAIDEKQGTPYVFRKDSAPASIENKSTAATDDVEKDEVPSEDSDQEELDRFIAEIEAAADREFEEEEAAEKEEATKIRYWTGDGSNESGRNWVRHTADARRWSGVDEDSDSSAAEDLDSDDELLNANDPEEDFLEPTKRKVARGGEGARDGPSRERKNSFGVRRDSHSLDSRSPKTRNRVHRGVSRGQKSEDDDFGMSGRPHKEAWGSDDEEAPGSRTPKRYVYDYQSSSEEDE